MKTIIYSKIKEKKERIITSCDSQDIQSELNDEGFKKAASEADILLIRPVGEWNEGALNAEYDALEAAYDDIAIMAVYLLVSDWNHELSPWHNPPVFGNEEFGDGATDTLKLIREDIIKPIFDVNDIDSKILDNTASGELNEGHLLGKMDGKHIPVLIAGYSLAGLFSLWATCEDECFSGCAAVSPSVWFPGLMDYLASHDPKGDCYYLSLGRKEPRTANKTMQKVGDNLVAIDELLEQTGKKHILKWNDGGHFNDPDKRMLEGLKDIIKMSL